jgi:erythronate-4-phosphate dehydrogenase
MTSQKKLRIVADENIPMLAELLGDIADITLLPGRAMQASDLRDADALLVRSITQVNPALLKDSAVAFVGTCTIGTDHIDEQYLAEKNIGFASAPGCNAAAVVDYVITAMLAVYADISVLQNKRVGIVGYGQVGSRLKRRLDSLGITNTVCDPFKEGADATLADILACDIISLHVPYTTEGEHPTHHLLGLPELQTIKPGALLLNTSRGPVVDNQALYPFLLEKKFHVVLDVYEDEPAPEIKLLDALDIATAHIAGYSLHGKIRGTLQVVEALFAHFGIDRAIPDLLSPLVRQLTLPGDAGVPELLKAAYDIKADARCFIECMLQHPDKLEKSRAFDNYRKNYPVRYEWSFIHVQANEAVQKIAEMSGFRKN